MLKQEDYKQHISERFNAELEEIKNHLLEMGGKVEEQLSAAVRVLVEGSSGFVPEQVLETTSELCQLIQQIAASHAQDNLG